MEKNEKQLTEISVAKNFDPAITYAGASSLKLSEKEMRDLAAPFDDLDYEITPQGFIYLPQAVSLKRLNDVIGIGNWGLLLINANHQLIKDGLTKVFFDGALLIRKCFVSRAVGEASYSEKNNNQSIASALEAAKSDCRQRCCKDLGIATDAWTPSFIRRWQKEHAIRVMVADFNGKQTVAWRRKDLEPFHNEVSLAPDKPTVPQTPACTPVQNNNDLPWLNIPSQEYNAAIKELLEGKTLNEMRKQYRISKVTAEVITGILQKEWAIRLSTCNTPATLTESFTANEKEVKDYQWLHKMFHDRRAEILNNRQTNAA